MEIEEVFEARMISGRVSAVEVAKDFRLDLELLGRRFDHEIAIGQLRRDP